MKKVKIALLGLGNVGRGVWNILQMNGEEIMKRSGCQVEVAKILVRDPSKARAVKVPEELITTNFDEILNDDSIKIIVEVMGGIEPAREYILKSLNKKKHIVTANKMLLATYGDELFKKADEEEVMLNYEASVAGGIPIIQAINESLTANKIEKLYGIINGTTNFILSKMELEGSDFENVLKEAQEKGYAEADPTSDIEGFDAQYKLAILSSLAFGTKVKIDDVYREGITKITSKDIRYAKDFGLVIKLLAIAKETDGKLQLRVHPTMIPATHPLAKDIVSILRSDVDTENRLPVEKNNLWHKEIGEINDITSRYYIRTTVTDRPGVLGEITAIFGRHGVSLRSVIQRGRIKNEEEVGLVLVTHYTEEKQLQGAINEVKDIDAVKEINNMIRIEDFN
ncbi:homoserine dehydrogenase [Clostridium sp.]|uniref:homoserine dehydrogenase n=1 Tax=Clostridium sp. TaxID=1506 RepID=UPI002904F19C|nr:homoserine dehydrogenase [Clostridium sp.]MDU1310856.1 homoserine dehydrogenase [Clostridium sp.]